MEIRVQGLIKAFDNPDKPVLKGLDVEIEPGQFVDVRITGSDNHDLYAQKV